MLVSATTTYEAAAASHQSISPTFSDINSLNSQSKLREILKDQSRREQNNDFAHLTHEVNNDVATQNSSPAPSSNSPSSSNSAGRSDTLSSTSGSPRTPVTLSRNANARRDSLQAIAAKSPYLERRGSTSDVASPHSSVYRDRSLRHMQQKQQQQQSPRLLSSADEFAPQSLQRTRSAVGNLSGGVDLKVVILGAQGK